MASDTTQNVKTFFKGQSIFKEGQASTVAYMVRKGSVNIYRVVNNRKVIMDRLGKGEIFGEMAIISTAPRTFCAEAAEYCELLVLTEQIISGLLAKSPKTIQHLTKLLIKRLQKTGDKTAAAPREQKSPFLSVCKILEMGYGLHQATAKKKKGDPGLSSFELSKMVKDLILISQAEIDAVIDQLQSLKLIEITVSKDKKTFQEKFIQLCDAPNFFKVATNLDRELNKNNSPSAEMEYVDLYDFAESVGASPEILYKKMAQEEIPETLICLPRERALQWAEGKDKDFFSKVKRKRKKIQDIEDVGDIVFVDGATLKDVFGKLGYYKLGVLCAIADDDAKDKILGNLAKKMAAIVQGEAERLEHIDEAEAQDIQDELVGLIKAAKGVAP